MIAYRLPLAHPAENLALEETLFRSVCPEQVGYFLLWQNTPSVIVGRHQNTLAEVNQDYLQQAGIPVVRRMTGGGAVYHDAGNLNYSFILPRVPGRKLPAPQDLLAPLLHALASLGIPAQNSGRNDITVDGRKISGTAQCRSAAAYLLHGAMLVSADLDVLASVLAGPSDKYTSKALPSVRSRVCNVGELLHAGASLSAVDSIADALIAHCAEGGLDKSGMVVCQAAKELAACKYHTWEWNYGASPQFTERRRERFPWGSVECCYGVENGIIRTCRLYGDFFALTDIRVLESQLVGVSRRPESILAVLEQCPLGEYFVGCETEQMRCFLAAL